MGDNTDTREKAMPHPDTKAIMPRKGILITKKGKNSSPKSVKFREEHEPNQNRQKHSTRRGMRPGTKRTMKKLKILTINTRGIKSKLTSLTAALHSNGTHIAAITETHLNNKEEVTIPGYQWLGKNRAHQEGGGVGFLIRNDIKDQIEEIEMTEENLMEKKWIKLKGKTNIAIAVIYGKQETTKKEEAEQQFEELITQINQLKTMSSSWGI